MRAGRKSIGINVRAFVLTQDRQKSVFQEVDAKAVSDARLILAQADHAAIATLHPDTGAPQCTRVGLAIDASGTPLIFVSALAAHTPALEKDPRCSLLVGDVGKGDPLAHPRLTIAARAEKIGREDERFADCLAAYLARHPKAKLYADLPDFRFYRLKIEEVSFNAGFGRAFRISRAQFGG